MNLNLAMKHARVALEELEACGIFKDHHYHAAVDNAFDSCRALFAPTPKRKCLCPRCSRDASGPFLTCSNSRKRKAKR